MANVFGANSPPGQETNNKSQPRLHRLRGPFHPLRSERSPVLAGQRRRRRLAPQRAARLPGLLGALRLRRERSVRGREPDAEQLQRADHHLLLSQLGEIDANVQGRLAAKAITTPFDLHSDSAAGFYLNGQPAPTAPAVRAFERATTRLQADNPYTGTPTSSPRSWLCSGSRTTTRRRAGCPRRSSRRGLQGDRCPRRTPGHVYPAGLDRGAEQRLGRRRHLRGDRGSLGRAREPARRARGADDRPPRWSCLRRAQGRSAQGPVARGAGPRPDLRGSRRGPSGGGH